MAAAAAALPALAQAQAAKPPIAQYWMSVETAAGMNMPGMSLAMAGMMGAQTAGGRRRTYGDWPNQEDAKAVPDGASLAGAHAVKGNYSPEIRFSLDRDFLDRVSLSADGNKMRWNAVGRASGYFATLYGAQGQDEIVFWSSSDVQEMGGGLMDYLPPAEAARLVREKVLMPPSATDCTVPAEVVKKAGTPMINFIAHGDEENFAHPPHPQDPKAAWAPDWAVKVRFKSTASLLLGDGAESAGSGAPAPRRGADEPARDTSARDKPEAPDPLKEGVNILRGILGR